MEMVIAETDILTSKDSSPSHSHYRSSLRDALSLIPTQVYDGSQWRPTWLTTLNEIGCVTLGEFLKRH
jgi:hypothetical protein